MWWLIGDLGVAFASPVFVAVACRTDVNNKETKKKKSWYSSKVAGWHMILTLAGCLQQCACWFAAATPLTAVLAVLNLVSLALLQLTLNSRKELHHTFLSFHFFFCLNWKHSDPCVKREHVKFHEKSFLYHEVMNNQVTQNCCIFC